MDHLRFVRYQKSTEYQLTRSLLLARLANRILTERRAQIARTLAAANSQNKTN